MKKIKMWAVYWEIIRESESGYELRYVSKFHLTENQETTLCGRICDEGMLKERETLLGRGATVVISAASYFYEDVAGINCKHCSRIEHAR